MLGTMCPSTDGVMQISTREKVPVFLTAGEVAALLRTTRKAVYAMAERGQLPGVTRIGRRLLVRSEILLDCLRQKCAPSQQEAKQR